MNGFVADTEEAFVRAVLTVMNDPALHRRMREAAPEGAVHNSWDRVFESEVYAAYRFCLAMKEESGVRCEGCLKSVALDVPASES